MHLCVSPKDTRRTGDTHKCMSPIVESQIV